MSKVSIEINGLKFGLRIKPEDATKLIEALQGYWVATRQGPSRAAIEWRDACDVAFDQILSEIRSPTYTPCEHCGDEMTPEACAAKRGVADVAYLTFAK